MKILIGNKNYSTWSMRPWLVLSHFEIEYAEEILPLAGEGWKDVYIERTPLGTVPVLEHDGIVVSESLAIIEYLADLYPEKNIWPSDIKMKAQARSAAMAMHGGFFGIRNAAPMNIRATMPGRISSDAVQADLDKMEKILQGLLDQSGGPLLCGQFCAVDAMFAPLAMRIVTYDLTVSEPIQNWIDALLENPAVKSWRAAGMVETQIVPQDELDMMDQQ